MDLSSFKISEFLCDKILAVGSLHSKNWDDIISSKKCRESDGNNTGATNEVSKNVVDVVKLNKTIRLLEFLYETILSINR